MHLEDILDAIAIEPPALVEPDGFGARAKRVFYWRRHVRANALPNWNPERIVGYDHAVLVVPDMAAERNWSILRVACSLRERGDCICLGVRNYVREHKRPRHAIDLGLLDWTPSIG